MPVSVLGKGFSLLLVFLATEPAESCEGLDAALNDSRLFLDPCECRPLRACFSTRSLPFISERVLCLSSANPPWLPPISLLLQLSAVWNLLPKCTKCIIVGFFFFFVNLQMDTRCSQFLLKLCRLGRAACGSRGNNRDRVEKKNNPCLCFWVEFTASRSGIKSQHSELQKILKKQKIFLSFHPVL